MFGLLFVWPCIAMGTDLPVLHYGGGLNRMTEDTFLSLVHPFHTIFVHPVVLWVVPSYNRYELQEGLVGPSTVHILRRHVVRGKPKDVKVPRIALPYSLPKDLGGHFLESSRTRICCKGNMAFQQYESRHGQQNRSEERR